MGRVVIKIGIGGNYLFNPNMDFESLRILLPKKTNTWRVADVEKWLRFIHLESYIVNFRAMAIDGSNLKSLNENDLKELHITSRIIIKKLLSWIPIGLESFDDYLNSVSETQDESSPEPLANTQVNQISARPSEFCRALSTVKRQKQNCIIIRRLDIIEVNFYYKFVETSCQIGRHANCQIQVQDENVEVYNTKVAYRHPHFYLSNVTPSCVTFVKIVERVLVSNNMRVEMGSNIFLFGNKQGGKLEVEVIGGSDFGELYEFSPEKQKFIVGRKITNDICFPGDNTLSNMHGRVSYIQNQWFIEDLGTTNGTWSILDGQYRIETGTIFKAGTSNIQFQCQVKELSPQEEAAQLKRESEQNKVVCNICKTREKNILYFPCNHVVSCEQCSILSDKCLVCRGKVQQKLKIFRV